MSEQKNKSFLWPIIFGLVAGFIHMGLSYYKINTAPQSIRGAYRMANQKKPSAEVIKSIADMNLPDLYQEHMKSHYGKEQARELMKKAKTKAGIIKKEEADPDAIVSIYETLYKIQLAIAQKPKKEEKEELKKHFWLEIYQSKQEKKKEDKQKEPSMTQDMFQDKLLKEFVGHMREKPFAPVIPKNTRNPFATGCAFLFGFLLALFYSKSKQIYTKILLGMIGGAIFGYLYGPISAATIAPLGTIFIRLIKMVVVPLVFASLTLGVLSLGDIRKIGRIGGKTIAYYLITTSCAISIGLVLANIVKPGTYIPEESRKQFQESYQKTVQKKTEARKPVSETMVEVVPTNPIKSMSSGNMLQIIFFALLFGMVLATIAVEKKEIIEKGLDGVNDGMVKMVIWVMEVAPIGVFALMADTVAKAGISVLKALLVYALVVLCGLILHILLVYGVAVKFLAKTSITEFFKKIYSAQLIAFSTSSSAATLPISMQCAEERLNIDKDVCSFVLPLGATINMDGTALYQGVAAVFIAQVYSIPLDFMQQLTILLTATLASIGTAAVPGAGIVILAMVLESIGVPTIGIALIMGVDRILDMCRTTVNVTGDLSATLFVHKTENARKEKQMT